MRRSPHICLAVALVTLSLAPQSWAAGKDMLTLEQAAGRGGRISFSGQAERYSWNDAGQLVRGRGESAVTLDPRTLKEVEPKADAADTVLDQPFRAALLTLDGVDEKQVDGMLRGRLTRSADGSTALIVRDNDMIVARKDGTAFRRPKTDGETELVRMAPDGSRVAYVQSNNLFVWVPGVNPHAITTDGGDELFCGKLDWVYQEEIYGRGDFLAHWWSPDSKHLAFLVLDESPVDEFTVIDYIERGHFRVKPEISNYPKVGDGNPIVTLKVFDCERSETVDVDLSRYQKDEPLIVRVSFTPDSAHVLFTVQDRIQTWAELCAADPKTGAWQTWIREENDSWVNRPEDPVFLADGSFLWFSERTDHKHLYRYQGDGTLIGPVTSGAWSIDSVDHLDEAGERLWFTANKDGAVNRNLYRIGLDGKKMTRLTDGDGSHSWSFNDDRSYFIDTVSSLARPPEVRLCSGDGKVLKVLDTATIKARDEYAVSDWELHEVAARDGFMLDVAVMKPVKYARSKQYPVWISTYSGPDAPTVKNRWDGSAWNQFLAQQGFMLLQVNVRTASGKGHYAIEQCYKRLGVQELEDLCDVVDWLCKTTAADSKRVGITGYSYGGFMAAYALTHSDKFALGIAGGGVFDWRMYDTIYTERYMSTPDKNKEGYEATSVLTAAKNLKGHLVIHHGVMDDNVHVQNAMQLIYALQKADKQFELMLYPQNRHGVRDGDQSWHLKQLEWSAMQRVLGGERQPM